MSILAAHNKRFGTEIMDLEFHQMIQLCCKLSLQGGPSNFGTKILQNTKKSFLYSQNLLIFIHRTAVVERHPI